MPALNARLHMCWRSRMVGGIAAALLMVSTFCYYLWLIPQSVATLNIPPVPRSASHIEKAIVVGKRRSQDATWLEDLCSSHNYTAIVYSTALRPEPGCLTPRSTRGREAPVYLSYILDYYDSLPKYSVFVHDANVQWHNDIPPEHSNVEMLSRLRFDTVDKQGYVNLRCRLWPGCPAGIFPFGPVNHNITNAHIQANFVQIYMDIFGVTADDVPSEIGNVCCAQFAVTREAILKRPKSDYERMLKWAMETPITSTFGVGWTYEKLWHIIFGMESTHCPSDEQCWCDVYGDCNEESRWLPRLDPPMTPV